MANPLSTLTDAAGGALIVPEFAAQPILDTIQNQPGVAPLADVQVTPSQKDVFHVISDDADGICVLTSTPCSIVPRSVLCSFARGHQHTRA